MAKVSHKETYMFLFTTTINSPLPDNTVSCSFIILWITFDCQAVMCTVSHLWTNFNKTTVESPTLTDDSPLLKGIQGNEKENPPALLLCAMLFLCYNWTTRPVPKTCTGAWPSFVLLLSPAGPARASAQKPIWPRHVVPHVPIHGSQLSKHSTSSSTSQAQSYLGQTVLNYSQSLSSAKWPDYRQLNLSFDAVL